MSKFFRVSCLIEEKDENGESTYKMTDTCILKDEIIGYNFDTNTYNLTIYTKFAKNVFPLGDDLTNTLPFNFSKHKDCSFNFSNLLEYDYIHSCDFTKEIGINGVSVPSKNLVTFSFGENPCVNPDGANSVRFPNDENIYCIRCYDDGSEKVFKTKEELFAYFETFEASRHSYNFF